MFFCPCRAASFTTYVEILVLYSTHYRESTAEAADTNDYEFPRIKRVLKFSLKILSLLVGVELSHNCSAFRSAVFLAEHSQQLIRMTSTVY